MNDQPKGEGGRLRGVCEWSEERDVGFIVLLGGLFEPEREWGLLTLIGGKY